MVEEQQNSKIERIALELNKNGLAYLANQQGPSNAFDYFKKAQKLLEGEIQVDKENKKAQSLLAVTCNNIAIYYKRTNKPKAALTYLKKALQIQAIILNDWLAASTTHLNVCAIYSYMSRHNEAVEHANLSIEMAQKAKQKVTGQNKNENIEKACNNIELTGMYNLAVQYEHLKRYQQAISTHKKAKQTAKQLKIKKIETNSEDSIERLQKQVAKNKRRMIEMLQKKREEQQKGNHDSMRRNIKNFKFIVMDKNPTIAAKLEKYNIYNDEKSETRRVQSVAKIGGVKQFTFDKSTEIVKKQVKDQLEKQRSISRIQQQ